MFEIRAAHRSRKISFFLSGSEVGVARGSFRQRGGWWAGAAGGGRGQRGWEFGRPEVKFSVFWVVEAAEPVGDDDDSGGVRVRVRGSGSPAYLEMRGGRGAVGGPVVEAARPAAR
jgi:hypothetical protein